MRTIFFVIALGILLALANARNTFVLENVGDAEELPPEFICNSCLEISRKVEEVLTDPKLLEKAGTILEEACNQVPADMQVKCVEAIEMYINQAVLFLQGYFSEENLCYSTGLCSENPLPQGIYKSSIEKKDLPSIELVDEFMSNMGSRLAAQKKHDVLQSQMKSDLLIATSLPRFSNKISDEKSCRACRDAVNELRNDLEDPETKIKVIKILLKACENAENHVKECKKLVFEYGPLVLANIDKYLNNNDLCHIVHVCDAAVTLNADTAAVDVHLLELPVLKHFRSTPAVMVM